MKNFWKSLNEFWLGKFDPLSVSIYRISLGLLIFVMFVANYFNWERFYSADGIISLHDFVHNRLPEDWCSIFYWTRGKIPVKAFWWIGFISSISFTVGFQTRLSTIILYVLQASMIHRNLLIVNGEDLVFRMLLFYSCFAKLNYCLSVDSWLRKKFLKPFKEEALPQIWPIRLIQINVALIYLISLPHKLVDDVAWINGQAIYYTMASNLWGRCPFPELFSKWDYVLSKIFTYGTVIIEGSFPILVWFKKTRLIVITLITLLHLGIAVAVPNVTFFTLAMVCAFWVYVPSSTIRNFPNKLKEEKLQKLISVFQKEVQGLLGVDIRSLATLRIFTGVLIIVDLIFRLPDLKAFYTDEGVLPRNLYVEIFNNWYSSLYLINGLPIVSLLLFIATGFFAFLFVIGFKTRIVTFILWFLIVSLHTRNPMLLTGGDTLLGLLLFWSMFLPLGACWSIDSLLNSRKERIPMQIFSASTIAILLQVVFVYVFTAISKISPEWIKEGSAIYYALNIDQYVTPFGVSLLNFPQLLKILTFSVFWFELIGPLLFFIPLFSGAVRIILVIGFLLLQLGFGSCLTVGIFPYITSIAVLLFLPSSFWDRVLSQMNKPITGLAKAINKIILNPRFNSIFSPQPIVFKNYLFTNIIVSIFLFLVFLWNIQSVQVLKFQMPAWLEKASYFFHLEQKWVMFAPEFLKQDFWYVFPGTLKNGKQVDLFTNSREINWNKPRFASTLYPNHRWRTYLRTLWASDNRHFPYYAQYLCHKWNKDHNEENKLVSIEFYYVREDTLPDYEIAKSTSGLIYKHTCY